MDEAQPYIIGAISALLLVLGAWLFKRHPVDVPVDNTKQKEVEKKTVEEEKKLEDQTKKDETVLEEKHDVDVTKNVEDLQKKTDEVVNNPDDLNNLLILTGKDVRGRSE